MACMAAMWRCRPERESEVHHKLGHRASHKRANGAFCLRTCGVLLLTKSRDEHLVVWTRGLSPKPSVALGSRAPWRLRTT
jgi:hypothetical protein